METGTTAVQVRPVEDARAHRAFCELPYQLYRGDPHWVPPLRSGESHRWSTRHPSLRSRWVRRFVALRNGRVVGRIAASTDAAFAARWQEGAGFFGFFECAQDAEASRSLFRAAEMALRGQGVERILGPVNLSTNDEVGLLVEGFAERPTVLTSHNPPYYQSLVEEAGYASRLDYHAYRCDPQHRHSAAIDRLLRMRTRPGSSNDEIVVRPTDPRRWESENRILLDLYNRSFADVWGFVPMSWDEYMERAREFRPFYRPELAVIAECKGRPVGFAVALPDINVALANVDGRLWPFGWLRLARSVPRIRSLRLVLLGVLPEYAGRGVAARIAFELASAARRLGMLDSELSLVQATNRRIQHVIRAFGGIPTKTYRLYEKHLQP